MNVRENGRVLKEKCAKMPEVDYLDRLLSGLTGLAGKTRNSSLEWLKCWNCKADFPAVFFFSFVMERGRQWGFHIIHPLIGPKRLFLREIGAQTFFTFMYEVATRYSTNENPCSDKLSRAIS